MILRLMDLSDATKTYQEKLDKLNEKPLDHEYGNKVAVLNEEYRVLVRKIIYTTKNPS